MLFKRKFDVIKEIVGGKMLKQNIFMHYEKLEKSDAKKEKTANYWIWIIATSTNRTNY